MAKERALIIGCGGIGCFWDSPESSDVLTHAHELRNREADIYFYDKDFLRAKEAARIWGGHAFEHFPTGESFDVIVIAANTQAHYELLQLCQSVQAKAVVVEKPFCNNSMEANSVVGQFKEKRLFINYSRNYHPFIKKVKAAIDAGEYGELLTFQGSYSKGLRHNGSHMLSLLHLFFEEFTGADVLRRNVEKITGYENVDLWLKGSKASGVLNGIDEGFYSFWELKLYFSKKIVFIRDFGRSIEFHDLVTDPQYPDYTIIGQIPSHVEKLDLGDCLRGLYQEVFNQSDSDRMSTINGLKVHAMLEQILETK